MLASLNEQQQYIWWTFNEMYEKAKEKDPSKVIPYEPRRWREWGACEPPPIAKYSTFITINFSSEIDIVEAHKKFTTRVLGKTYFNDRYIIYNIEHTDHPHIHCLVEGRLGTSGTPAKIIRDISRVFAMKPNFIDVKNSKTLEMYTKRSNYVKGLKQDAKLEKVKADEEYRKKFGFDNYYEVNSV